MTMRSLAWLILLFAATTAVDRPAAAQEAAGALEARVWLDRGDEPVLRRGEDVRVYYRTSEDAFAAIFRINTDGRVSLIYPQHPDAIDVVRGGRDYRLLFPHAPEWRVDEDPGVGYLFIVASPEPLDFSRFPFDRRYGWDLGAVSEAVYSDPYVAIDDYVAQIVPDWELVPYGLDFVTYSVGETHSYPRFLCYDCHTYQSYSSWNPYDYNCTTYRVVIWDDPYFYPQYRYSGMNVVVARPVRALPRYEVARRSLGDAVAPIVRARAPVARRAVEYKEPTTAAVSTSATPPVRRASPAMASPQERPSPQQVPDTARTRPTLQRRPSARLPARTPPAARPTEPAEPKPTPATPTPTSPRAPSARPQAEPREPQAAPTPTRPVRTPPTAQSPRSQEPRAVPTRPSTTREPQAAPSRPSRTREPQAAPSRPSTTREPQAAPSRPSARSVPSRSSGQPSAGARPQAAPRSETPRAGSGTSRPSASPEPSRPSSSRPATSSAPPARSAEPRPTVRPRPADPN
jgi:hypothetical protein